MSVVRKKMLRTEFDREIETIRRGGSAFVRDPSFSSGTDRNDAEGDSFFAKQALDRIEEKCVVSRAEGAARPKTAIDRRRFEFGDRTCWGIAGCA